MIPGGSKGETDAARALNLDRLMPTRPVYAIARRDGVFANVIPLAQFRVEPPACGHAEELEPDGAQVLTAGGIS